jgi:hypothetical protein
MAVSDCQTSTRLRIHANKITGSDGYYYPAIADTVPTRLTVTIASRPLQDDEAPEPSAFNISNRTTHLSFLCLLCQEISQLIPRLGDLSYPLVSNLKQPSEDRVIGLKAHS